MVDAFVKNLRVATLMQDGEYHCVRRLQPKINSIRETADESSPQLPMVKVYRSGPNSIR